MRHNPARKESVQLDGANEEYPTASSSTATVTKLVRLPFVVVYALHLTFPARNISNRRKRAHTTTLDPPRLARLHHMVFLGSESNLRVKATGQHPMVVIGPTIETEPVLQILIIGGCVSLFGVAVPLYKRMQHLDYLHE